MDRRLALIRTQLGPKFAQAGSQLQRLAKQHAGVDFTVHIAKHARRHVNPPQNTWLALSASARGYKMLPHVELGFWDDRLFLWVGVLQEAKPLFGVLPTLAQLPQGFALADSHINKTTQPLNAATLAAQNTRFKQVAKAEWLLVANHLAQAPTWQDPTRLWRTIQQEFLALLPVYQLLTTTK